MEPCNIGKLSEEWNTGILEHCVQQKNQEKNEFFSRRIIPAFHYSNIPPFLAQYFIIAPYTLLQSPGMFSGHDTIIASTPY
jgi:hypothetical protein